MLLTKDSRVRKLRIEIDVEIDGKIETRKAEWAVESFSMSQFKPFRPIYDDDGKVTGSEKAPVSVSIHALTETT
jgi:hypothetical protein